MLLGGQGTLVTGDTDGMAISQDDLAALVAALVAIDSKNPDLVPGDAGEAAIARFVAGWLTAAGLDTEIHELGPDRANEVATATDTCTDLRNGASKSPVGCDNVRGVGISTE
jgi:acetylornithine deacetylase